MGEGRGQKWETLWKRLLGWEHECNRCMSNDVGFHRGVPHKFRTLRSVLLWFVISAVLPLYVVESRCHCRSNRVGECRGSNNLLDAAGPAPWDGDVTDPRNTLLQPVLP